MCVCTRVTSAVLPVVQCKCGTVVPQRYGYGNCVYISLFMCIISIVWGFVCGKVVLRVQI